MSLRGKAAVITGGTSGIGLATAYNYLKEGVNNLVLLDVCENKENVQQLRDEFGQANIVLLLIDISKQEAVEKAFKEILERFQQIDIVVNCAGVCGEKDVYRIININLIGLIKTSLIAMNTMSVSNGGKGGIILNVASTTGLDPFAPSPSYSASKHGVVGFTRSMASDCYYAKHGVKFITICPGITKTPLIERSAIDGDGTLPETGDFIKNLLSSMRHQTADQCGRNIAIITATARNGTVYILDEGRIEDVTIPEYWQPTPAH